jgi:hypothetical protein
LLLGILKSELKVFAEPNNGIEKIRQQQDECITHAMHNAMLALLRDPFTFTSSL